MVPVFLAYSRRSHLIFLIDLMIAARFRRQLSVDSVTSITCPTTDIPLAPVLSIHHTVLFPMRLSWSTPYLIPL